MAGELVTRNKKGQFLKGTQPLNKGKSPSRETRLLWSKQRKGKRLGIENPFYGKKHSEEVRKKMSLALKGRTVWNKGLKGVMKAWNKGKKGLVKMSETTKQKMSEAQKRIGNKPPIIKGSAHWSWKGGITPIHLKIRHSLEYKLWREAVFKRDNFICIWCGDNRGGNLEADHIKPFSLFPEFRFAIDNGRTLCRECHKTTDTWGERAKHYKI